MPHTPPQLSIVLTLLRTVQGWSQKELAEASGIPGNLLSDYERGRKPLSRERLEVLTSTMGLYGDAVDQAIAFIRLIRVSSPAAGLPSDAQRRRIEIVAADFAARTADFTRWALTRLTTAARAEEERQDAQALWARLKKRKPAERRRIVESSEQFRSWALCELVCRESVDAARDSADRALDLADLALRIAELTPGDEVWRSRVQGYAWAHVGNARRVKGDLPGADEAFHQAGKLWQASEDDHPSLLDEALVLGLEASLRRAQRRLTEALDLLNRALVADRGVLARQLLLNKANVFLTLGDFEGAVAALRQATSSVEANGEPQMIFALRFNLAVNLCFLARFEEAGKLLPKLRELAALLSNGLDLVRLRWLEARISAGLGEQQRALESLTRVRQEFTSREIAYEAALVSLEIAVLYLKAGRNGEVRTSANQMLWIFQAQGVHREALAALRLFCEAAEREKVTLELAQKILEYLHRAQNDPDLRFEAPKEQKKS